MEKEKALEKLTEQFWRKELRYKIENDNMETAEQELKEFLEKIRNGDLDSDKYKYPSSYDVEMEEAKEMLLYHILEKEKDKMESLDKWMLKGSWKGSFDMDQMHEPGFNLPTEDGIAKSQGYGLKISHIQKMIKRAKNQLGGFRYAIKIFNDVNAPDVEIEVAERYEQELEERIKILGDIEEKLEKADKANEKERKKELEEEAKEEWIKLAKLVRKEEQEN